MRQAWGWRHDLGLPKQLKGREKVPCAGLHSGRGHSSAEKHALGIIHQEKVRARMELGTLRGRGAQRRNAWGWLASGMLMQGVGDAEKARNMTPQTCWDN